MRLVVTDPVHVIVERDDIVAVRAEDASGSFGILKGHADFLTVLESSVLTWRSSDGRTGYCAVDGGILTVSGGDTISVATREAHLGDDLETLRADVIAAFRAREDAERTGRTAAARLRTRAIRGMVEALRGNAGAIGGLQP